MTENDLARIVFKKGLEVHRELGAGLLESAYEECLEYELKQSGLFVERQKSIPIYYKEKVLDKGFVADLIIDNKVIIELKSVKAIEPIHLAQIITYLKLTDMRLGCLINCNVELFKQGFQRVANRL